MLKIAGFVPIETGRLPADKGHRMHHRLFRLLAVFVLLQSGCSESSFSGSSDRPKKVKTVSEADVTDTEDSDADKNGKKDAEVADQSSKEVQTTDKKVSGKEEEETIEIDESVSCILAANGTERNTVKVNGENCINNGIDRGGADFDDYHLVLNGEFLVSGTEIFSTKQQDIQINYNLGTPGSTQQIVSLAIVDCLKAKKDTFEVSTGSGQKILSARRGDRFNVVMTVTSGCYGRKDIYDLIKDGEKAFRLP